MLIFDTSIWVDALNGKISTKVDLLKEMISNNQVVMTPTIIQGILQGIRFDEQYQKVKTNLSGFYILKSDPIEAAIGASSIFRNLRKKGITIRKPNDCLIAYEAINQNIAIIHNDNDFDLITQGRQLKIWPI